MARSTCWSLLVLGLAMLNYVMHRAFFIQLETARHRMALG